jgi:hypothetical protein
MNRVIQGPSRTRDLPEEQEIFHSELVGFHGIGVELESLFQVLQSRSWTSAGGQGFRPGNERFEEGSIQAVSLFLHPLFPASASR